MSIKSNYFKMSKEDFNKYLDSLKNSNSTIYLLGDKYFYTPTSKMMETIIELNKRVNEFDLIIDTFTEFSKRQIIQSFLIDEIESTNKIENIIFTKHDIFSIINNVSTSNDKKIVSISNIYRQLLNNRGVQIKTCSDIRNLYDIIFKNSIDRDDLPDGKYFRKDAVYISDGSTSKHVGTLGEENIIDQIKEFIKLYNSDQEIFTKMILSHFMFEYIHPFYDGNGRLGRFLFSNGLYLKSKSYFSFLISHSFELEKNKYYKSFKLAYDKYEFNCLNSYVELMLKILSDQVKLQINSLMMMKKKLNEFDKPFKMSKSEGKIYKIINEATIFTHFGISNDEIINETGVSKRTLIYTLNKFKDKDLLDETKIGKYTFHRIKENMKDKLNLNIKL